MQQISARLEATDKDRHRLRERLLTTASQLETAVAEAREKDRDRRSTIKAYKNKIQVQEQVRSSKGRNLNLPDFSAASFFFSL